MRLLQEDDARLPRVSLVGGPLNWAGERLGLVRNGSDTILLGVAIAACSWLTVVLLADARGVADDLFVLPMIAAHVRLLVVIPLFFVCETILHHPLWRFVNDLLSSEIVPDEERPKLLARVQWLMKHVHSPVPDLTCLLLAGVSTLAGARIPRYAGETAAFQDPVVVAAYFAVAGTVFRFLLFRWLWRIGLWCWFLWRLSRLKLHLLAGHSDRAGGLGGLEVVHGKFWPLVAALAAMESALCAEELSRGMPFPTIYPIVGIAVGVGVLLVFAPLMFFTTPLRDCRLNGYFAYTALASRYVAGFEKRWLSGQPADGDLLGTDDLQSLADLSKSIGVVRGMRTIPAGRPLIWTIVIATLIPMAPLLLFEYSAKELVHRIATFLFG